MKQSKIFLLLAACIIFGTELSASILAEAVVQKKTINKKDIVADFFFCKNADNQRPLILLGGAEGGKALSEQTDKINIAIQRGYAVLVLAYFGIDGLPPTLQSIPLEYFENAVDWVCKQPNIDPNGVGIIAGSKGAEAALLLATTNHNIKAVVAIAPSAYVFWGIRGPGGKNQTTSSWSRGDKDISFAPMVSDKEKVIRAMRTGKFLPIYSEAIASPDAARGEIKIELAKAPILFVSGKKDELWPSFKMAESMMRRLKENKYPYHCEHISYNTGHGVIHKVPESWNKIFDFLETYYPAAPKLNEKTQAVDYHKKENKIQ
jgi:dienelactone hydrolase